jgi:DNA-binding transcriptional LysR family regulator
MLAAEQGSFRRAAELLNFSKSTISRRIQLLENRIGIALFERTWTGVRLTAAGERFIRDASVGANQLRQAVNSISTVQRGHFGELRVGLMASLASGFLADLFGAFHRRFPSIDMMLEEATSQANAAAVLNGRLDAAFIPGDPRLPGCRAEMLWEEKIYVAVPDTHPAASLQSISWDDIRDETFLVTAEAASPEIEDYLVRQLSSPGFRPRISIQHIGRENLLNMVSRKFGVTLTTDSTLGAVYPGVCFHPIGGTENVVSSSVVWSESNQNPALKFLLEMGRDRAYSNDLRLGVRGPEWNPRGANLTLAGPIRDSMNAYDDPPDGIRRARTPRG